MPKGCLVWRGVCFPLTELRIPPGDPLTPPGPTRGPDRRTLLEGHSPCSPLTGNWSCSSTSLKDADCQSGLGAPDHRPTPGSQATPPSPNSPILLCPGVRGYPGDLPSHTEQRRKSVNGFIFCPNNAESLKHLHSDHCPICMLLLSSSPGL